MSGVPVPAVKEVTPFLFSGDARIAWVIGAVPFGSQTKGSLLLERLPQDFPRQDNQLMELMEEALLKTLLELRGLHGFQITGDVTRVSGMHIERSKVLT